MGRFNQNKDAMLSVIIACDAADKRSEIRLEKIGESVARVKIRAGFSRDEGFSLAILEQVKAKL
jgi:hypothetical protein